MREVHRKDEIKQSKRIAYLLWAVFIAIVVFASANAGYLWVD
jgi:hypothetical protein